MAAAVDKSRLDRLLNAEDPPDAAERGVTYEFLERLLRKQKLSSLTTRQVVKQYVVPQTFNSRCSLSGLLRQIHPQSVGRATHYVVHPWDGSFERLVSALGAVDGSHDDEEGNPPYFWIDVFALNQRQQVEGYKREEDAWLHRDEMFTQLRNCMRTIQKAVVILDPVIDPMILKRSWCLFECAQALQLGREVILCAVPEPPDCDPFLDVVFDLETTLSRYAVSFAKSEATIPVDKEWLDKEVLSLSPLGAKWLDEKVGQEILGWLGDRAAGRVLAQSFLDPEEKLDKEQQEKRLGLMQSLGKLLATLDRAQIAKDVLEKAVERSEAVSGAEEELTLSMKHDLACLNAKHFKELRKADHQLRHILALRQRRYPEDHPLVVESLEALARVLKERRKLTEAIALFKVVAAHREKTLGPTHFQTLVILNVLALTLQKREQYKEAERVFRRVVSAGIETLGATNLDVMVWSNNLAVLYQDTKQLDKAEVVLRTMLRNAEHALGPTHPHTLTLVFNLGYCLWGQKRDRAAEAFFRRELAGCEVTKGPDHRDTQRSRQNLARLVARQAGREKEAEAILRGETKPPSARDGDTSNPGSPNQSAAGPALANAAAPPKKEKRVAISMPEVQQTTPVYGHLVKVAAGLSALPPPRGVDGPRGSSTGFEGDEAPSPNEGAPSPTSDGDDRTADDSNTGEERSANTPLDDEDEVDVLDEDGLYHEEEEDEAALDDDAEDEEDDAVYYDDDEEVDDEEVNDEEEEGAVHRFHSSQDDEEGRVHRFHSSEDDAEDAEAYVIEGGDDDKALDDDDEAHMGKDAYHLDNDEDDDQPVHRRMVSKETMTSILSEDEEVVEYDDTTISDSFRIPDGRDRNHSQGRQRREQTVTSDDELLAEQLTGDFVDENGFDEAEDDDDDAGSFHYDEEHDYTEENGSKDEDGDQKNEKEDSLQHSPAEQKAKDES